MASTELSASGSLLFSSPSIDPWQSLELLRGQANHMLKNATPTVSETMQTWSAMYNTLLPVHNATAMFSDSEGGGLEIGAEFPLNQCVELKSCVGSQAGRSHENAEPGRLGGFGLNNTFKSRLFSCDRYYTISDK